MCAVDQKRPFFPRAGPFLDLLPFKGPFSLTGALTGRPPYGKAPYGEASYGKVGPLQEAPCEEGRSLREGPGSRTGPSQRKMTKRLTGRQGPYRARVPFGSFSVTDDEEAYGKAGLLREALGLYGQNDLRKGLLRGGLLTGRPLTGRLLTGRPLTGRFLETPL